MIPIFWVDWISGIFLAEPLGLPAEAQHWEPQAAVLWAIAGRSCDLGPLGALDWSDHGLSLQLEGKPGKREGYSIGLDITKRPHSNVSAMMEIGLE